MVKKKNSFKLEQKQNCALVLYTQFWGFKVTASSSEHPRNTWRIQKEEMKAGYLTD